MNVTNCNSADGCRVYCVNRTKNAQQLAAIYSTADYFINPTKEDNFSTVNLEAIACGTPVITYDVGGAKETIRYDGLLA